MPHQDQPIIIDDGGDSDILHGGPKHQGRVRIPAIDEFATPGLEPDSEATIKNVVLGRVVVVLRSGVQEEFTEITHCEIVYERPGPLGPAMRVDIDLKPEKMTFKIGVNADIKKRGRVESHDVYDYPGSGQIVEVHLRGKHQNHDFEIETKPVKSVDWHLDHGHSDKLAATPAP